MTSKHFIVGDWLEYPMRRASDLRVLCHPYSMKFRLRQPSQQEARSGYRKQRGKGQLPCPMNQEGTTVELSVVVTMGPVLLWSPWDQYCRQLLTGGCFEQAILYRISVAGTSSGHHSREVAISTNDTCCIPFQPSAELGTRIVVHRRF